MNTHWNRREWLGAVSAPLLVPLPGLERAVPPRGEPRNLILVLTDDQRFDALGCAGHPFLKTPHLDRLAKEGAMAENHFVTTALCSPSRATILSGQYAHRHGVLDNATELPPTTPVFPELLRRAGYRTAYIGKWHMGGASDAPRPGFDHWASFRGQGPYFDPTLNVNGVRERVRGYTTDILTDQAVAWIRAQGSQPFCLILGHKASHADFKPAPRHADLFSEVPIPKPWDPKDPEWRNVPAWVHAQRNTGHGVDAMYGGDMTFENFYRNYHRCLVAVDDSVGRMLEVLEQSKLLDSTFFAFTSDNGFLHGEHGLIDKRCMYEESIRVPFLARAPGLIEPGTRISEMTLNLDLSSTFLAVAGQPAPESMQGQSFLPLLRRQEIGWRPAFLYEYFFERDFAETPTVFGIRTKTHKLMMFHGIRDKNELFDLVRDPREKNNLIDDPAHADLRKTLTSELQALVQQSGGRWNPVWSR